MGEVRESDAAKLDLELSALARQESSLRLRLGQALELLGRSEGFRALGFSSLSAYAVERAERGARWVEAARCLARRLEALPLLRAALQRGELSWSMADLLARLAQQELAQQELAQQELAQQGLAEPCGEAELLALAQGCTLREVRAWCVQRQGREVVEAQPAEERSTLSLTMNREDAWLLEATRVLLAALGTKDASEQLEALLAEAQETLSAALPRGVLQVAGLQMAGLQWTDAARERWREQLRQWREEAERRCEATFQSKRPEVELPDTKMEGSHGLALASLEGCSVRDLDAAVREVATAMAGQELRLARLLLALHRADGWRRLGYATEGQYARERLGMSRSSLLARRALALRLEQLPVVAQALSEGRLGVEAALQVVRIATESTEAAWLARARQRTVKHLREEVTASLMAVRMSGQRDCPPPLEAELHAVQELERVVLSGGLASTRRWRVTEGDGAWPTMLASLQDWLLRDGLVQPGLVQPGLFPGQVQPGSDKGVQLSAGGLREQHAGRVTLRLRVSREVHAWWRALEAQGERWLPQGVSWLRFACLCVWQSWRHLLGVPVAYGRIYLRDRYQCSSPVCCRGDVTPHHLTFRSAGGGEEDENLASLCTWCHLFGVHGGTIRARGPASCIEWELGTPEPCVRVRGRERLCPALVSAA